MTGSHMLIKACFLVLAVAAANKDYDTCAASPGGCTGKNEADANTLIQSRVRISADLAPDFNAEDPPVSDLGDAGVDIDHMGFLETDGSEATGHVPGEELGPLELDEEWYRKIAQVPAPTPATDQTAEGGDDDDDDDGDDDNDNGDDNGDDNDGDDGGDDGDDDDDATSGDDNDDGDDDDDDASTGTNTGTSNDAEAMADPLVGYTSLGVGTMCRGTGWYEGGWPKHQLDVSTVNDCATKCSAAVDCTAFDFDEDSTCYLFGHSAVHGDEDDGSGTCYTKQATYSVQAAEATGCPSGTIHVMSESECQAAAAQLGKVWSGGSVGTWGDHVNGCLEGDGGSSGNGTIHFNNGGQISGPLGFAVCKEASHHCNDHAGDVCTGCLANNSVCYAEQSKSWCDQWSEFKWCAPQATNSCLTQHCLKCGSTPFHCERCDSNHTLSITGECLEECPPGEYELPPTQTSSNSNRQRECSLCNGATRRRRADSCTHCPDGHISQSPVGLDNCTNIQTTCNLAQCQACASCLNNGQDHLQQCLLASAPNSICINFNEVWCGNFMSHLETCEGFSLGCYHLLMCHSPCVCSGWKMVRCGGDFTDGVCTPSLLEEFTHRLTKSASLMNHSGDNTKGAESVEPSQKNSAKVSLMQRKSSNDRKETAEQSSLDETLEDKCVSLSR